VVVLLGGSIAATTITQILRELNGGSQNPLTSDTGILWFLLGYLLPWALTFILLLFAYRFVPNAHNKFRDTWLAALLASVAIEALKYGYGVYVVNFSNYGAAYGALGGFLLFMFFVWLSSYVFLIGAEVASEYPNVMRGNYSDDEPSEEEDLSLPQRAIALVRSLFVAD
jgi:membrane protein